jgi:hypothetical protein
MTSENMANNYQELITRCWSDDGFKSRLLSDPVGVLREAGYSIPEGISVRIHESTQNRHVVCIPHRPNELTDEELSNAAGGSGLYTVIGGVRFAVSGGMSTGAKAGLVSTLTGVGILGGGAAYLLDKKLNA